MSAPDYWEPCDEEPKWTYELYYKYMNMEADYQNEPIMDELHDVFELDLHEISSDFNLDQMEEEARELDELF